MWLAELSELSSSDKCHREKIDTQLNGLCFEVILENSNPYRMAVKISVTVFKIEL